MAGRRLARLLLVDNRPDFIDPVRDHLIGAGWRAEVARTPEEALQKVRENRYQICVLDKRLRDDHDIEDRSGIELIPALWRIDGLLHFAVLTQYEDIPEATEITRANFLTRERWCEAYIPKASGEDFLISELDRVESEAITLNWDLSVEDSFLETVLEPLLRETDASLRAERLSRLSDDARLLLQWIFYDRPRNLRFELLDAQGRSGARILRAIADNSAGWVLKVATRLAVEEEWDNYLTHVRSAIGQRPDVDEGRCQVGIHLGVLPTARFPASTPRFRCAICAPS